jgi:hypothetical protein
MEFCIIKALIPSVLDIKLYKNQRCGKRGMRVAFDTSTWPRHDAYIHSRRGQTPHKSTRDFLKQTPEIRKLRQLKDLTADAPQYVGRWMDFKRASTDWFTDAHRPHK